MAWSQSAPFQMPPEIQAIVEKAQKGQSLSDADQKKLMEWSEKMTREMSLGGGKTEQTESNETPELLKKAGEASPGKKCPDKRQVDGLPSKAPELTEYTKMLSALANTYGGKNASSKRRVDGALGRSQPDCAGADLGAALALAGSGDASVYAILQTARKTPLDFLAANNLGVVLKGIGDYKNALAALLWAEKLRPGATLAQINLGWFWYDLGDCDRAEGYFRKAAARAPDASGPRLGLGLIARCRGDDLTATRLLREALRNRFSGMGAIAYRQSRQAVEDAGNTEAANQPVSDQKGDSQGVTLPEQPIIENKFAMADMEPKISRARNALDQRIQQIENDILPTMRTVVKQALRAAQDPDNAVVFQRDFSKELFLLEDITRLMWGPGSIHYNAVQKAVEILKSAHPVNEHEAGVAMQRGEKYMRLQDRILLLYDDLHACGSSQPCRKPIEAKIDVVRHDMEILDWEFCKQMKSTIDYNYAKVFKAWKVVNDATRETGPDYYAFTTPIIEKVYPPSFNELLNYERELRILNAYKAALGLASGLPNEAKNFRELKCVEPEPLGPPAPEGGDPKVKQSKAPCPFDDPLKLKMIVVSMTLDCDQVKLEGGEGILVSLERNFKKRETTFGLGVGAQYEGPGVGAEAAMMVEVTVGANDTVKDVAFGSEVKVTAGRAEASVSGRVSMESGPEVGIDAGFDTSVEAGGWGIDL